MIHRLSTLFCVSLLCISLVTLLAACGGSGDSGSTTGNRVSTGVITGFGSVFVNGTRFNTDSATITADDFSDETGLEVGMKVKVIADRSSSTASSVSYDGDVKGPLDTASVTLSTIFNTPFFVMGQKVIVGPATVIDNSHPLPWSAGNILEVSGMRQADNSILATFIEKKLFDEINKFKVIGTVNEPLDTTEKTFTIGGLTVNYRGADVDDLIGGHPAKGQLVEVKDEFRAYTAGSGTLSATKVEPFSFLDAGDNNAPIFDVEIESVVASVAADGSSFTIPNFIVNISADTTFRFGTSDDISPGTVLQIRALENSPGVLDATRITFNHNSTRIEANTDSVDAGKNQVTLLVDIIVQVNSNTEMEDKLNDLSPFTVADISVTDHLRVRGFIGSNGVLTATRLRREDSGDSKVEIRGIVSNVNTGAQSFEILGKLITAGTGTLFNDGLTSITADDFFAALTNGLSNVEATWDPFNRTGDFPQELELEDQF